MSSNQVVPLKSGARIAAIVPTTVEEVFRLATAIAKSGLAPRDMQTAEKLTVAIMHGMEIGLPPMQAVQRIAVVNGRPTIWGDAIPALLLSRGFRIREWMAGETGTTRVAFCEITRPDGTKIERGFSETNALTAGLLNKPGPWKQYPDRMLQMRARGFAARDGAADVLSGLYIREEIDEPMKDITPTAESSDPPDPDKQPDTIASDIPDISQEQPDELTDAKGVLAKLRDDLNECKNDAERMEVWEGMADLIGRLSEEDQDQAEKIFETAA